MKVLEGVTQAGLGKVWLAGKEIKPEWQMKRDLLPPTFKNRWSDIPIARI
jgi:DNA polymerase V